MDRHQHRSLASAAARLNLEYEFRETDLRRLIAGVEDSTFDAGIAAISVTAEREKHLDFSHPYYNSGLGIAVLPKGSVTLFKVIEQFFSWEFLKVAVFLFGGTILMGFLVWLLERRSNPQFGGTRGEGVVSAMWWSAVTLTTVGDGDKAPITLGGRLVALVWMLYAIIIVASFTAAITSALTVNELESVIRGPEDLPKVRVASVAGTTGEAYLNQHETPSRAYSTPLAALRDLVQGRVDAVVYDASILKYWARKELDGSVFVLPNLFEKQYYAIALPSGSVLRKPLNAAMLEAPIQERLGEALHAYLGE